MNADHSLGPGCRRPAGFTLIELMIVVAVVAILAAVALPSYFGSIRKSRRADAIAAMSQIAQAQERWRANNATYSADLGSGGLRVINVATTVTTVGTVSTSQYDLPSGYYRMSVSTDSALDANRTSYTATATAAGGQTNDKAVGTSCAVLTSTMTGGNVVNAPAACWSR